MENTSDDNTNNEETEEHDDEVVLVANVSVDTSPDDSSADTPPAHGIDDLTDRLRLLLF